MPNIRTALRLDAVASGTLGVLLLAFAGVLDGRLGLNVTLPVGSRRRPAFLGRFRHVGRRWPPPCLVLGVIALNVAWVATSVVFAVAAWGGLTGLGRDVRAGTGRSRGRANGAPADGSSRTAPGGGCLMSAQTRSVVDELLRRLAAGTPDDVAELYADRVDWRLDWPPEEHDADVPWIRNRSSRVEIADHYRTIAAEHLPEDAGFDLEQVLVDGPDAVVIGTIGNTVRHTGKSYVAHVALHLTVEDALIVRHHVYEDSLAVARAWAGG